MSRARSGTTSKSEGSGRAGQVELRLAGEGRAARFLGRKMSSPPSRGLELAAGVSLDGALDADHRESPWRGADDPPPRGSWWRGCEGSPSPEQRGPTRSGGPHRRRCCRRCPSTRSHTSPMRPRIRLPGPATGHSQVFAELGAAADRGQSAQPGAIRHGQPGDLELLDRRLSPSWVGCQPQVNRRRREEHSDFPSPLECQTTPSGHGGARLASDLASVAGGHWTATPVIRSS